jgi:4-diphosphocytidyl-2-C-methyl-D-erythritol kinase
MPESAHMVVRAPAKLNLVLAVGDPRDDGYHPLVSVMEAIDMCDTLQVFVDASVTARVQVEAPALHGGDTLVTRAITQLLKYTGMTAHVRIHIDKKIPIGAGLGGGSSDAAAALGTVNRLLGTPCDDESLAGVAASIGSDVPFFLHPAKGAVVRGRGEVVAPIREVSLPSRTWLLAWPGTSNPTGDIYARFRPSREHLPDPRSALADAHAGRLYNDLSEAALEYNPQMRELYDRMVALAGHAHVQVAGSGAAIAALLPAGHETSTVNELGWNNLLEGLPKGGAVIARSWRHAPDWL